MLKLLTLSTWTRHAKLASVIYDEYDGGEEDSIFMQQQSLCTLGSECQIDWRGWRAKNDKAAPRGI